jgi:hypothetical protein
MSEPIEHRSELDKAEEGDGQLLVPSRDADHRSACSEAISFSMLFKGIP